MTSGHCPLFSCSCAVSHSSTEEHNTLSLGHGCPSTHAPTHTHKCTHRAHEEARWPLQMVSHTEKKPAGWQGPSALVPGEKACISHWLQRHAGMCRWAGGWRGGGRGTRGDKRSPAQDKRKYTGWGKSKFTVVSMGNREFILVPLFIRYCIIFHMNNVNPLLPHLYAVFPAFRSLPRCSAADGGARQAVPGAWRASAVSMWGPPRVWASKGAARPPCRRPTGAGLCQHILYPYRWPFILRGPQFTRGLHLSQSFQAWHSVTKI